MDKKRLYYTLEEAWEKVKEIFSRSRRPFTGDITLSSKKDKIKVIEERRKHYPSEDE